MRRGFQDRTEAQDAYEMTEWFATSTVERRQHWRRRLLLHRRQHIPRGHNCPTSSARNRAGLHGLRQVSASSAAAESPRSSTPRPENPEQDFGQGVLPVDEDKDGSLRNRRSHCMRAARRWRICGGACRFATTFRPLLHVPFWREASTATYTDVIERSGVAIFIWGNSARRG